MLNALPPSRLYRSAPLGLLLLALIGGCAPAYQPFNGSAGYSETPVRPDEFEVTFVGSTNVNITQARYYATLRAAEVALQNRKPFLEILLAKEGASVGSYAVPENTTIFSTPNRDRDGHRLSETTTINRTGGYVQEYTIPISTLVVRLLNEPTPNALKAVDLIRAGQQQGVKFSPATEAAMVRPTTMP